MYRYLSPIDDVTTRHGGFPTGYVAVSDFQDIPTGWIVREFPDAAAAPFTTVITPPAPPSPLVVFARASAWFDGHPLNWQMTWAPLVAILNKGFTDVQMGLKSLTDVRSFVDTLRNVSGVDPDDVDTLLTFFDTPA